MQISIIDNKLISDNKSGNLSQVSGFVRIKNLDMFAKICLKYHICCGLFFDNRRNLENFKEIWFLQFDFDDGTTVEDVVQKIKGYNMVIMGSKNHMIDKNDGKGIIPRFHVFLPLVSPIIDSEYYKFLIKKFATIWEIKIDPQVTDATRYMFKHSTALYKRDMAMNFNPSDQKYVFEWVAKNKQEEAENIQKTEKLKKENAEFNISFEDRYKAAQKLVAQNVGEAIEGMSGDALTFSAMCYGVKCGLSDSLLEQLSQWYNCNFCKPKWNERALKHKIKCAKKRIKSGDYYPPKYINKILGRSNLMDMFK